MNLLKRLQMAVNFFNYTKSEKTFTGNNWKRGLDLSANKDKGVTLPMKDSSIVYTCVTKIASNLPQAILKFYRGEDEIPFNDPIVRLFNKPNDMTNQAMFLENSTMFFALYGEVFWYLPKSAGQLSGSTNLPAEIIVLNPKHMQEVVENDQMKGWMYNNKIAFDLDEILQIKFPNPYSFIRGMSPIDGIQADMDSDYLAGKYSKQFFVNGAAPSTVFTTPDDDESSDEQKKEFLKQWNALHRGVSNSHKAAILNAGNDIKTIGLTQEEMHYVDSRQYSALRIMSAFSVPPPIAGDFTNANYSNISVAKQMFWNETLQVYMRRYANMINSFIVEPYDNTIKAKFDLTEVVELQKDAKDVSEVVAKYAGIGVPVNVLAEVYHLPFGDIQGLDVGYQNISMIEVGSDGYTDEEPAKQIEIETIKSNKSIDKSVRTSFLQQRAKDEKIFIKELKKYWFNQRSKILNKLLGKKEDVTLETAAIMQRINIWDQEDKNLVTRFTPVYTMILEGAGEQALVNIGSKEGFIVDQTIINQRISILKGINNSTYKTVERIVKEGVEKGKSVNGIAKDIKGLYSHISKSRSMKIARTETGSSMNSQQLKTYNDKGVAKKRWVGGNRDSHSSITGTTVGMNESFIVGSEFLMYPGDPNGSAEETINCTCSISPVIE